MQQSTAVPTLCAGLAAMARSHPGRIAIRCGDEALDFAGLVAAIERMAGQLRARGVTADSAVAALSDNRPGMMIAYYAVARLGAMFVPINPVLTPPEIAHVVRHSGATLLLHEEEHAAPAAAAMPDAGQRLSFEALEANAGATSPLPPEPPGLIDRDFLTIYTSGSTGVPKAVVLSHEAEVAGNASLIDLWGITASDVVLVALPLGFLYGLSTAASMGLQAGAEIVLLRRFRPADVLDLLVARRATVMHGVPTMFTMMLNYAETQDIRVDLGHMRLLVSAGAPLSQDMRTRFRARFGVRIDDYYAMTEARPVFGRRSDDARDPPPGAVGTLAPGVEVTIIDAAGRALGPGEHGEFVVRAPSTFRRYANAEDVTAKVLEARGFRTGDVGYVDAQGYYYITGRIKDIIIRGGANIAPAEVEGVLASHPAVLLAAVVGMPDATLGEVAVAYVELREGQSATPQELIAHCAAVLAPFKVPALITQLPRLPVGATGKVDKNALKAAARGLAR